MRDSALLDASKACAALKAKEGTVHHTLKHRSCSDRRHSVALEMRWLNSRTHRSVWAPIFGTVRDRTVMKVEGDKQLPLVFKHDCRLQYERLTDSYYICIPVIVCVPLPDERLGEGIVVIDPGVRANATCYDPAAMSVTKWGAIGGRKTSRAQGTELLGWLSRKIDRLTSKARHEHGRRRRRIRAVANRIRKRVTNLTAEYHHKLALFLCQNYAVVLIPKFSAKEISRRDAKKQRVVGRRTARMLMQMAPYRFRQFLTHKARETGTRVVVCDEYWTSKTCGSCGMLNMALGAAKTFMCPHCGWEGDRDTNASRNILLRYLVVNKLLTGINSVPGAPTCMGSMGLPL